MTGNEEREVRGSKAMEVLEGQDEEFVLDMAAGLGTSGGAGRVASYNQSDKRGG